MKYFALPLLMAALILPSAARAAMTDDQKKEVEALVKDYILNHGELLIESVNKYQAKQEEETNKQSEGKAKDLISSIKTDKDLAFAGDPNGDVVVVEFFDYSCGYCKKAFSEVTKLVDEDKKVKMVFYDMPILGPDSVEAAKWSLAAKKQGKYYEYHKALMGQNGSKTEETFRKLATDVGMDADKLAKDKADPSIDAEIKKHLEMAQSLNISGTPGFLINEKVFRGYIPYDVFTSTIKQIREEAAPKK